jgi:hypothetical protein
MHILSIFVSICTNKSIYMYLICVCPCIVVVCGEENQLDDTQ